MISDEEYAKACDDKNRAQEIIDQYQIEHDHVNVPYHIKTLEQVEREHILDVLKMMKKNKQDAARVLGITTKTIYNKLEQYGVYERRRRVVNEKN